MSAKYDPLYHPKHAYRLTLLFGANQQRLADFFEVDSSTITTWKKQHDEFAQALKKGGVGADAKVAQSFYERACGYDKEFVKKVRGPDGVTTTEETKHYPADVNGCIKWLTMRSKKDPESLWREDEEEAPKTIEFDDMEIAKKVAFILAKAIHGETIEGEAKRLDKPSLI